MTENRNFCQIYVIHNKKAQIARIDSADFVCLFDVQLQTPYNF